MNTIRITDAFLRRSTDFYEIWYIEVFGYNEYFDGIYFLLIWKETWTKTEICTSKIHVSSFIPYALLQQQVVLIRLPVASQNINFVVKSIRPLKRQAIGQVTSRHHELQKQTNNGKRDWKPFEYALRDPDEHRFKSRCVSLRW